MKSEDIARLAGVSRSTVSRVINNYPNVPEETRQRVMEVIKRYNYRPNAFARTLAGKKSETIGVFFIVDSSRDENHRLFYNDFFTAYLDAIVDVANKNGYYVLVQTILNEDDFDRVGKAFIEKRIDGGILIGTRKDTLNRIKLESIEQHLVVFDYELQSICNFETLQEQLTILNTNDRSGIEEAVKFLVSKGHKTIGFIKGIEDTLSARLRHEAYEEALANHGLKYDEDYILEGQFDQATAYEAMKNAIKHHQLASAYICANDYMAIAAIDCLHEEGYKVPEDVSFIGFDNTRTGQLMSPKLTTLAPDFYSMAKKAVEIIKSRNTSVNTAVPEFIEYKVELIERESVLQKI